MYSSNSSTADGYFRLFPRYARAETRLYYPEAYPQPVHSSQIRAISSLKRKTNFFEANRY